VALTRTPTRAFCDTPLQKGPDEVRAFGFVDRREKKAARSATVFVPYMQGCLNPS
jgi:hypothetical protein